MVIPRFFFFRQMGGIHAGYRLNKSRFPWSTWPAVAKIMVTVPVKSVSSSKSERRSTTDARHSPARSPEWSADGETASGGLKALPFPFCGVNVTAQPKTGVPPAGSAANLRGAGLCADHPFITVICLNFRHKPLYHIINIVSRPGEQAQ